MSRFRAEAASRGLPPGDVEDWIRTALPALYLAEAGDGPVAVRVGGNPMLPDGAPEPSCPFAASVDCALIPRDSAGLPLPLDGHLLFFASVEGHDGGAEPDRIVYVPAGTPVAERPFDQTWRGAYPERRLRTLWRELSWRDDQGDFGEDGQWVDTTSELGHVWSDVTGPPPAKEWTLQLGGHPLTYNVHPAEGLSDDWVLLATWRCGDEIWQLDGGLVHWVVRRQDLAELRFEETYITVDMV